MSELLGHLLGHVGALAFATCGLALIAASVAMVRLGRVGECLVYGVGAILLLGTAVAFELDLVPQYRFQQDQISRLGKMNEVLLQERDSALEQVSDCKAKAAEDTRILNAELSRMQEAFGALPGALTAQGLSVPQTDLTALDSIAGVGQSAQ